MTATVSYSPSRHAISGRSHPRTGAIACPAAARGTSAETRPAEGCGPGRKDPAPSRHPEVFATLTRCQRESRPGLRTSGKAGKRRESRRFGLLPGAAVSTIVVSGGGQVSEPQFQIENIDSEPCTETNLWKPACDASGSRQASP